MHHHHHNHHSALDGLSGNNANSIPEEADTVIGLRQSSRFFGVDNIGASAIVMANHV